VISKTFNDLPDYCDICIIGGGPVGLSLALALRDSGLRCVVLEAGGTSYDRAVQSLSEAVLADPAHHDSMLIATARRLGGTSNLWGGTCVPYDPIDFAERQYVDAAWPIKLEDIEPFYDEACRLVGAGPAHFHAPSVGFPSTPEFSFQSLARWSNEPKFQLAHKSALQNARNLDIRTGAVARGFRVAENGRIDAVEICRPDGTQPREIRAGKFIVAAGGVESTRLLLNLQRQHPALLGGAQGGLGKYYMGHLVGQIADIRLANSRLDELLDFHLDEHGNYVRRRFTASAPLQKAHGLLNCSFWPVVRKVAAAEHGNAILSSIFLALAFRPLGSRLLPEALWRRHVPAEPASIVPHLANILCGFPSAASYLAQFMWKRHFAAARIPGFYLRSQQLHYGLSFHAEQRPNAESRITLSEECDPTGLPKARIDFRFHEFDVQSVLRSHALLDGWLRTNKLGELIYSVRRQDRADAILAEAKHGRHQIGTTRMGRTAGEAVLDGNLKCFGLENLYVASSSALPTSSQANPTLTAIALALRLARHLAASR
jgi:choline dehydrogenase-like flavoprotein